MIPFEDRIEIVRSCKYVDAAVPQYDMDKLSACKKLGVKVLFVGDDWYGTEDCFIDRINICMLYILNN